MKKYNDGLTSFTSGLGTDRDKQSTVTYTRPYDGRDEEYINGYRGAWLVKRIVDQPAGDAFRKWRDWQAETDQISAIEKYEKRREVNMRQTLTKAMVFARLLGRGHVYISIRGDDDPSQPLNPERIRKDGLASLTALSKRDVNEGEIDDDPISPNYGRPKYYELASGKTSLLRIHPSRLVTFYGALKPDLFYGEQGESVLVATLDAIKRHDSVVANVASLVHEARVDVISIPGLSDLLRDPVEEAALLSKFRLVAQMKGNYGMTLLNASTIKEDNSETWEQKNMSFATLPDIIDKAQQEVAGAARIPRAMLFGTGAGGLGATGDMELSSYYDMINDIQSNDIEPELAILDEVLIRSALGNRPPEVWYSWASLWQMSDKEKAEIGKIKSETFRALIAGGYPLDPLTGAITNALTETGAMPGLEMAYDDWLNAGGQDDNQDQVDDVLIESDADLQNDVEIG
jgi:phage-related protein (TIGR01555 family)